MFEAFQFGPFLFRTHLLFLLIGAVLTVELFVRLALDKGLPVKHLQDKAAWYILAFLLGGRFFAVLVLYRVYLNDPLRFFIVWDGSFSFVGGCTGVAIALAINTHRDRSTMLQWLDTLVPPVTLGLSLDWLGRFFGALSYGRPTNLFFGVVVESMSVRYTVPIHPVQLYYALFFFSLTLLLLVLRKRRPRAGLLTLVGILAGSIGVILFDFLRGDFAVVIFAKASDFLFLALLFVSLGMIAALGRRISTQYSLWSSILLAFGTIAYLIARPLIGLPSIEWRFSQFLAVLAILATTVYVVVHRCKYPYL